ncbi:MAG: hypothetical protein HOH76_07315 [Hellea sp.]|jgi:hypothetical protein|nr:hypothetical protein [Hellea sp.]
MSFLSKYSKYASLVVFGFVISTYSFVAQADEINEVTVSDVIVDEAEMLGKTIMVPGWMLYLGDEMNFLYEYAGTMTALTIVTDKLSKKQQKWVISKCGSGCYVNVVGVVNKDETIMATEIEKMGWKDKLLNIAIGEKNQLVN